MTYHNSSRARIEVEGEKPRPRLLDVLAV